MIQLLATHELNRLRLSGRLWVSLGLTQCLLGFLSYWLLSEYKQKLHAQFLDAITLLPISEEIIHPLFAFTTLITFILIPLLSLQNLSLDRKNNMLNYFLLHLSEKQIILGKFLALFQIYFILIVLPLLLILFCLNCSANLDLGQSFSSLLGLLLLASTTMSICIFVSTLIKDPILATLTSLLLLFALCVWEWGFRYLPMPYRAYASLGLLYPCKHFLSGSIYIKDIIYYSVITFACLQLSLTWLKKTAKDD